MITGHNPLTAVHVARNVQIVGGDALILDLKENAACEGGMLTGGSDVLPRFQSYHLLADLCWRTVDESKVIPVDPSKPLDTSLFDKYNICITGAAMKQFQSGTTSYKTPGSALAFLLTGGGPSSPA
jgi:cation-transporting ATPase 13A1